MAARPRAVIIVGILAVAIAAAAAYFLYDYLRMQEKRVSEAVATEEIVVAKGVGKGAAAGAAVGAATGAVSSRRDIDEAAGVGAIYGGARSGLDADREKQAVFKNCMRGRGYRVLN